MVGIHVTEVGKQVAVSGLLPETADAFLVYIAQYGEKLSAIIHGSNAQQAHNRELFDFCLLFACLASPEFSGRNTSRYLHWGFDVPVINNAFVASCEMLLGQPWQAYKNCCNAAEILIEWIRGAPMRALEGRYQALRAGKIQGMAREAAWCLTGFSEILAACTRGGISDAERHPALRSMSPDALKQLRSIIPAIRFLSWRLNTGFPAESLWMSELKDSTGRTFITRQEVVALHASGFYSYTELRQRENWEDVVACLKPAKGVNAWASARKIQEAAHEWHKIVRQRTQTKLCGQVPEASELIQRFFTSRGHAFERAFEALMDAAGIRFTFFDVGRQGAFDYLIHIDGRPDMIIECKTKQGDALVDMWEARTVLAAAAQYNYNGLFCSTLCNPGINPDVLAGFSDTRILSLVEAHDMAVALTGLLRGKMSPQGLYDWLTQPGLARADNLYSHLLQPEAYA